MLRVRLRIQGCVVLIVDVPTAREGVSLRVSVRINVEFWQGFGFESS